MASALDIPQMRRGNARHSASAGEIDARHPYLGNYVPFFFVSILTLYHKNLPHGLILLIFSLAFVLALCAFLVYRPYA